MNVIKRLFLWLTIPAFIFLGPFLIYPAFNLIDDGASLYVAQNIVTSSSMENLFDQLIEEEVGRLRPLYLMSFAVIYLFFGTSAFYYWLFQYLILTFTMVGMALLIYKITHKYWLSTLGAFSLLGTSTLGENFYRLGTAEPKQILVYIWLLVLFYEVVKNGWSYARQIATYLLTVMALLIKETSVVIGGIFGLLAVWNSVFDKKRALFDWLMIVPFLSTILLFIWMIPEATGYSSGFQLNLIDIWGKLLAVRLNLANILYPLTLAVGATLLRLMYDFYLKKQIEGQKYFWQFVFLSQLFLFLVIGILPWQHQLGRYFYPIYLLGILYISIEVSFFSDFLKRLKLKRKLYVSSLILAFLGSLLLLQKAFQASLGFSFSSRLVSSRFIEMRTDIELQLVLMTVGLSFWAVRLLLMKIAKKVIHFNEYGYHLLLWVFYICSITILTLLWAHVTPRAYLLSMNILVILLMVEFEAWQRSMKLLLRSKQSISLFFASTLIIAFFSLKYIWQSPNSGIDGISGNNSTQMMQSFDTHQTSSALTYYLIEKIEENTQVFVLEDDYEIIFEIGLYASNITRRPVSIFTSNQSLVNDLGSKFSYLRYTVDPGEAYLKSNEPKILIARDKTLRKYFSSNDVQIENHRLTLLTPEAVFGTYDESSYWTIIEKEYEAAN